MGFLRPTHGGALINGHDCWSDGVAARRHVAYLPGELRLYENMTGRQIVHFLAQLRGEEHSDQVDALARRFDIDIDRPLANLALWSIRAVLSVEPFVKLSIPQGESYSWRITYTYYRPEAK